MKKLELTRFSFILQGTVIGIFAGVIVSLFRLLIEKGLQILQYLYPLIRENPQYIILVLLFNLVLAWIVGRFVQAEPNIKGSGIPQVEGQLAGDLEMSWWPVLWRKFVGGVLGNGSGLFLGREGPSIQLGATVAQGIAEKSGKIGSDRRILISSGAAAGLAAAFNAPLAGVLFVLEEVYHNFSPLVWMTSLAAAVASNFISLYIFGLTPVLHMVYTKTLPLEHYGHLLLLGVALGLLGYFYQYVLLHSSTWYAKLNFIPAYLDGVLPFLLVIPIGLYATQFLGGGNQVILALPATRWSLIALAGIFVLRFVFSMVSYGSGLPGGIFLPILTLGAIIGAFYGQAMINLNILPDVYFTNFVIFAMAGYFAGIGKAPFTAIILVTEMVGNVHQLMPLAVVSLVAFGVVDILGGAPIYESLLQNLIKDKKAAKLSGEMDRLEFSIFAGSSFEDKQVRDVKWPVNSLLIAIRRGDREIIPHGDSLLRAGDTLVILTDQSTRGIVRQELERRL